MSVDANEHFLLWRLVQQAPNVLFSGLEWNMNLENLNLDLQMMNNHL